MILIVCCVTLLMKRWSICSLDVQLPRLFDGILHIGWISLHRVTIMRGSTIYFGFVISGLKRLIEGKKGWSG